MSEWQECFLYETVILSLFGFFFSGLYITNFKIKLDFVLLFGYFDKYAKEVKMNDIDWGRLNARARVLKALAHPSRLFIAEELRKGERCVCELTDMIGSDVSTVSRHLSVLKNAGILRDEKRGNQVFYSLRIPCILDFFGCVEAVLAARAEEQLAIMK